MKTRLTADQVADLKAADATAYAMENDDHAAQVLAVELAKDDKARKTLVKQVVKDFLANDDAWHPAAIRDRKVVGGKVRYGLGRTDMELLKEIDPAADLGGTTTRTTWKHDTDDVSVLKEAAETFEQAALTPGNDANTIRRLLGCARSTRRAQETLELYLEAQAEAASESAADQADVEKLARELETIGA